MAQRGRSSESTAGGREPQITRMTRMKHKWDVLRSGQPVVGTVCKTARGKYRSGHLQAGRWTPTMLSSDQRSGPKGRARQNLKKSFCVACRGKISRYNHPHRGPKGLGASRLRSFSRRLDEAAAGSVELQPSLELDVARRGEAALANGHGTGSDLRNLSPVYLTGGDGSRAIDCRPFLIFDNWVVA